MKKSFLILAGLLLGVLLLTQVNTARASGEPQCTDLRVGNSAYLADPTNPSETILVKWYRMNQWSWKYGLLKSTVFYVSREHAYAGSQANVYNTKVVTGSYTVTHPTWGYQATFVVNGNYANVCVINP